MKDEEPKKKIANRKQALQEYSKRLENDCTKAEALVQDTLEYAIDQYEKCNGDEMLDGWLLSIMHNIFLRGKSNEATIH